MAGPADAGNPTRPSEMKQWGLEIKALSEERTQEVAAILLERNALSNPIGKARRKLGDMVACTEQASLVHRDHLPAKKVVPLKQQLWRLMKKRMPILDWLPNLTRQKVTRDVIAGVTVGIIAIPQGMSYASVAGLPYVYGLYAACIPPLVYGIFGQSRQLAVGPVAVVSLVVQSGLLEVMTEAECPAWYKSGKAAGKLQSKMCPDAYVKLATLTAFVSGLLLMVAYACRLGFFISFLGKPVVAGYTAGAAVIIILSQLKSVFDFDIPQSQLIQDSIKSIAEQLGHTNRNTFALAVAWLVFLQGCRFIGKRYKRFALVGALAPFVSCVLGIVLLLVFPALTDAAHHVAYVGTLPKGVMPFVATTWRWEMVPRILPTAVTACYVGYIEAIGIGKAMAAKHNYYVEPGQELMTLGLCNVIGGMFAAYPVTGSFSRSAVKLDLNAMTQFSSITTSIVLWCAILFLTQAFFWLPKFVLSSVVISAVMALVDLHEAYSIYKISRLDGFLWLVAFACVLLLGVEIGIGVAVATSLAIVVYESVRPQLTVLWRLPGTTIYRSIKQESHGSFVDGVFIVRLGASLYFANAQYIKDTLEKYVEDLEATNRTQYLVLEMTPVISLDSSAAEVLKNIIREFRFRGMQVAFCMVGNRVAKTMQCAGLDVEIGKEWFFSTVHEAVLHCLRHRHLRGKISVGDIEQQTDIESHSGDSTTAPSSEPNTARVMLNSEVGVSNDFDNKCTGLFISLPVDRPLIMSEITDVFRRHELNVIRAQVDTCEGEDDSMGASAKHAYFLQRLDGSKLSEEEAAALRADLEVVVRPASRELLASSEPGVVSLN